MGRHRSDPLGFARLLLVGLAILVLLGLILLGVLSLVGSLSSDAEPAPTGAAATTAPPAADLLPSTATSPSAFTSGSTSGSTSASPAVTAARTASGAEVPTVFVECRADSCPLFVRVTGGDVVEDRDLSSGQRAAYFQPALDVVLGDASTVYVEVNGEPRSPGKPGERQTLTVKRRPAP
ncbi:hypothetical protein ACWEN6_36160 [Sphaerisporangium sp. NPDC004334]